jgi:dihydrofolate reductase
MPDKKFGLVVIEMSMSLDGFIAGPEDGPEHRLGTHGGEKVFDWYATGEESYPAGSFFKAEGANRVVVDQMFARFGAFVSGRRTYDLAKGWNGTHPCNGVPVFILTHHPDPNPPQGESDLVFVTDGIERAIARARKAAKGKDVALLGGSPGQQALAAGLVDEIFIHVSPILIGGGVRMFENLGDGEIALEQVETIAGPKAAHLRYRVHRSSSTPAGLKAEPCRPLSPS